MPLVPPLEVTTAVRVPMLAGSVFMVTVSWVEVAAVTVPTALLLKRTELLAGVVEKPVPLMVIVGVLIEKIVVLGVTVGAATMAAT